MTTVIDASTTRFEMKNLPRGFGHTLGNAIRRIILAYNLGGSITGIKIKGVPHEYFVIDGVKENVVNMLLNFKKLRFVFDEKVEALQWVSQRFKGIGTYTADKLKLHAGIQLLNPEEFLFEITDAAVEINMEMRIEKGYGYYSLEYLRARSKKEEGGDVNLMLIDNDFKLVDYVKYDVEEVIEDFTGSTKDSLTIEIKTGFTKVNPKEMLMFAGEALASYARLFIFDDLYIDRSVFVEYDELPEEKVVGVNEDTAIKTMPIDALPLSERTRNALIKNTILYVEDLEKKKKAELLLMKGIGKKAIDEINMALGNIGKMLITN
jgi:DNA-directed RNA polymerase subunit alpha